MGYGTGVDRVKIGVGAMSGRHQHMAVKQHFFHSPYLPRLRLPLQVLPHLVLVAAVQILKPLLVGDQRVSALGIR